MGRERNAKAARRAVRATAGAYEREMKRQGVDARARLVDNALRTAEFIRGWRGIISLRDGTDREVQDIEGAHAVAVEVLQAMGLDLRDVRVTLERRFNNTVAFYCRPDGTRIAAELEAAGERQGAAKAVAA